MNVDLDTRDTKLKVKVIFGPNLLLRRVYCTSKHLSNVYTLFSVGYRLLLLEQATLSVFFQTGTLRTLAKTLFLARHVVLHH